MSMSRLLMLVAAKWRDLTSLDKGEEAEEVAEEQEEQEEDTDTNDWSGTSPPSALPAGGKTHMPRHWSCGR